MRSPWLASRVKILLSPATLCGVARGWAVMWARQTVLDFVSGCCSCSCRETYQRGWIEKHRSLSGVVLRALACSMGGLGCNYHVLAVVWDVRHRLFETFGASLRADALQAGCTRMVVQPWSNSHGSNLCVMSSFPTPERDCCMVLHGFVEHILFFGAQV